MNGDNYVIGNKDIKNKVRNRKSGMTRVIGVGLDLESSGTPASITDDRIRREGSLPVI